MKILKHPIFAPCTCDKCRTVFQTDVNDELNTVSYDGVIQAWKIECPVCRHRCNLEWAGIINPSDVTDTNVDHKSEWISVEERLPEEGKYVIVWVGSAQVARIEKGITEEERQKMKNGEVEDRIEYGWSQSTGFMPLKRSNLYKACDVHGNNRVPYCWKANGGPMEWFGQNVTHWMPLPEPPDMKGGAE